MCLWLFVFCNWPCEKYWNTCCIWTTNVWKMHYSMLPNESSADTTSDCKCWALPQQQPEDEWGIRLHTATQAQADVTCEIWLCQPCTHASGLALELPQHMRFSSRIYIYEGENIYIYIYISYETLWFWQLDSLCLWTTESWLLFIVHWKSYLEISGYISSQAVLFSVIRGQGRRDLGKYCSKRQARIFKGTKSHDLGLSNHLLVTFLLTPFRLFGNPLFYMWWFTWSSAWAFQVI